MFNCFGGGKTNSKTIKTDDSKAVQISKIEEQIKK